MKLQRGSPPHPGVEAVAATSWLPVSGLYHSWSMTPDFDRLDESERWENADMRFFVGDYFDVMDIALIQGESPSDVDSEGSLPVWVSQGLAEATFPGGGAVGSLVFAANETRRQLPAGLPSRSLARTASRLKLGNS